MNLVYLVIYNVHVHCKPMVIGLPLKVHLLKALKGRFFSSLMFLRSPLCINGRENMSIAILYAGYNETNVIYYGYMLHPSTANKKINLITNNTGV